MTHIHMNQQGITHLLLVLGIVLVVIGFAGYEVVRKSSTMNPLPTQSTTASQIKIPAKIQSKADVHQAAQALANEQISNQLNPDQLNNEVNNLL